MPTMKTPGVYIVEKSAFPNSVVQVATAVPAFIGYTQKAMSGNSSLLNKPIRITSLSQFHSYFGAGPSAEFKIVPFEKRTGISPLSAEGSALPAELPQAGFEVKGTNGAQKFELAQTNANYIFYASMRLFFANGGGVCYVTSIGSYDQPIEAEAMIAAVHRLKKEAEPTMVVIPEAVYLSQEDCTAVQKAVVSHCGNEMKNRFAILDIPGGYLEQTSARGRPVERFRDTIGTTNLDYAATYYPWLNTDIHSGRDFSFCNIEADSRKMFMELLEASVNHDNEIVSLIRRIDTPELEGDFTILTQSGKSVLVTAQDFHATDLLTPQKEIEFRIDGDAKEFAGSFVRDGSDEAIVTFTQGELSDAKISFKHDPEGGDKGQGAFFVVAIDGDKNESLPRRVKVVAAAGATASALAMAENREEENHVAAIDKTLRSKVPLYGVVMEAIAKRANILPPAAAMAGLYTMVDNTRGVWKAPANVSVAAVASPTVIIDSEQQENLNVSTTGRSINAIRPFVGEGTLVWGARTLDGNSLDWRYINVRRTMIMLEESIHLAAKAYVFEPNTTQTWVTMKSMIENFLTSVWKQGGLAGVVPEDAFSVHVGLGESMTPEDILEGILRITVLVAVTRPAEFIEITFQQQMQKS